MAWRPVVVLLVLAPFMGEVLSTATSPLELLLPWNLALFAALYGGGALLCREVAHRWRLGVGGLVLLGAAYGVFEEALVDRFWFDPAYARDAGVGDYARVWHSSLLLATHLTAFHAIVSVTASVLIVTWLFPAARARPWLPRWGLALPALAMLAVLFVTYESYVRPPPGPALAAIGVGSALAASAWLPKRRARTAAPPRPTPLTPAQPAPGPSAPGPSAPGLSAVGLATARRVRAGMVGWLVFGCTAAHFLLVYAVPSTGLPWPVGLGVALVPVAGGYLVVRRRAGGRWFPVVAGVVGFFVGLDFLVGLGGRYDLSVGALVMVGGLVWLRRRGEVEAGLGPS